MDRVQCQRSALWLWLAIPPGSFAQIVGFSAFVESTAASDASGAEISVGVGTFFERPDISCRADIHLGGCWIGASDSGAAQTDPVLAALDGFVLFDRCLSVQVIVTLTAVSDKFPQTVRPPAFRDRP